MNTTTDTPRVWIADLEAYNSGRLVGRWVDATDLDELEAAVDEYSHGGQTDWAIHDHDGFLGIRVGEYEPIERVHELACAIAGCDDPDAMGVYLSDGDGDPADFSDAYVGDYDDWADFAWSLVETYDGRHHIPTPLGMMTVEQKDGPYYVDFEAIGRDWRLDGCDFWGSESGGRLYVFRVNP